MPGRAETLSRLVALSGLLDAGGPWVADAAIAQAAVDEQIAPLLGARIVAGELQAEPDARARLVSAHLACRTIAAQLGERYAPLLAALVACGIPTLLLKGGALVRTVYSLPGSRSMADLDVLVPGDRWHEAQAALAAAGATSVPVDALVVRLRLHHEKAWAVPGAVLDLHRRLSAWPLFRADLDGLFARARRLDDGLLVPAAEDLFVSLAMHAAQDGFVQPLRSVLDGLAVLGREPIDAERLRRRAHDWGARRAVATWLGTLLALGLPREPWAAIALDLGRGRGDASSPLPRPLPPTAADDRRERWRARWRLVRAADDSLRPLTFLTYRGVLRACDGLLARLRARITRRPARVPPRSTRSSGRA
jgi:hypothetical protein